jgi:alpha-L-fucosidase 2
MPFGPAGSETLTLNLDSLWSGGPFEVNVSIPGGKHDARMAYRDDRTTLAAIQTHP